MRPGKTSIKAGVTAANSKMECFKSEGDEGPSTVMKAYFESQNKETTLTSATTEIQTDALLILDDGIIPAHAAILSGSSAFFRNIFETQGFIINPVREIIMPEFSLPIMEKVIHLIYDNEVYLKTGKEVDEVRSTLKYLDINVDSKLISVKVPKSSTPAAVKEVKAVPKYMKSQLLRQSLVKSASVESIAEKDIPLKAPKEANARDLQTEKMRDTKASDADSKSETGSHSDDSDSEYVKKQRRIRAMNKVQTVKLAGEKKVRFHPVSVSVEQLPSAKNIGGSNGKVSEPVVKKATATRTPQKKSPDDTDTSTDHEADETRYKNQKWFLSEAKRCQKCKTSHDTAALASQCLTGHGRLRCYFCFRVVKNTEMLFNHFQRAHKKAGRENFVMCPFCDQSIPFKSVSCHVISLHMTDSNRSKKNQGTVSRKSSAEINTPPAKRPKLAGATEVKENDLRVGNLDCTIRHVKTNGKTWVFVLRRNRP